MADRPKSSSSEPHSDHVPGTFSKDSKPSSHHAGDTASAKHENRFAEVQRKSREARERLDANQRAKAEAEEQRAEAQRQQREPAYSEWDSAASDPKKENS